MKSRHTRLDLTDIRSEQNCQRWRQCPFADRFYRRIVHQRVRERHRESRCKRMREKIIM